MTLNKALKEFVWKRKFVKAVRRINPKISRRMAMLWAEDWIVTIDGATSLSPEDSAREELSVWEPKGE